MNLSIIRYILGRVLQFLGVFLLLPVIVSLIYREFNNTGLIFLAVAAVSFILGTVSSFFKPKNNAFYAREGFVTVSLSWILLSFVGAVPFVLTGEIPHIIDAVFETVSGFTTTGASILSDVEAMSQTAMFWRCFTNWIGGMGVLVFIMAILPLSGSYNMHLMRAESTGPSVGKLVPRVKNTAKILYGIYLGLTLVLIVSYMCAGMKLYDALIISFSTMGTGGFANLNASLGGYSHAAQVVSIIFMILCGINFNAYFLIISRKPKEFFKIEEVRWYLIIRFMAAAAITVQIRGSYGSLYSAAHDATFQVVSIMTTTGFSVTDFNTWPMFSKTILLMLMVIGGCAGSTSGGIKVSRLLILFRTLGKEESHLTHPRSVKKMRLNGQTVVEETSKSVYSFLIAYVVVLMVSVLIVSADGFDFTTSFTSVLSMLGNVGPGLSVVGPAGNYSGFSDLSKITLFIDMLAGRLEIFPMMVLFYFGTWKRG